MEPIVFASHKFENLQKKAINVLSRVYKKKLENNFYKIKIYYCTIFHNKTINSILFLAFNTAA